MEEEVFDAEEYYEKVVKQDTENVRAAMGHLIDTVSKFMSVERVDDLTGEDFATMVTTLDFAKFVISGVMYTHGLPYCGHEHEEDEDDVNE